MSLLSKQERNSLCNSTQPPPTNAEDIRKKRVQDAVWATIMNWINCEDPRYTCQKSLSINLGSYTDESIKNQWSSQLREAGYTVVIENNQMIIS